MALIFVNYRRETTDSDAGRLSDELKKYVGSKGIFLDVEGIAPGVSFPQVLQSELASCEVMLVVIGKDWVEQRDKSGKRRLDYQEDWVRLEIGIALKRGIPVVPVLVHGAKPLDVAELPDDLKPLAERQAHALHHDSWESDVKRLVDWLSAIVPNIAQVVRVHADARKPDAIFRKSSLLACFGNIILIGVAYQISLKYDPHPAISFFIWLAIGISMGKWHASRVGVNVVRDVLLGCTIAVGGAMVMSLGGNLIYDEPFLPKSIPEWQYTAVDMTVIMVSFIAGGALPLFIEKGRTWTKRRVRLEGKV